MASRKSDFTLPTFDDIFSTQEQRDDAKLSKIRDIPISEIDDFPDHPFKVRDDEDMLQLVESVKDRGVITPATVRQKEDGRYGIVVDEQQTAIITKIAITITNYTSCVNNRNITNKSAKNLSDFPIKAVVVSYDCACTFSRREQKKRMGLFYDVEKEIKEKGMSIDDYLTEMLMLNSQFKNLFKNSHCEEKIEIKECNLYEIL